MLPVAALVNWPIGRQLYKINRRAQDMSGQLAVMLMESLTGRKIVKAFGREDLEQSRFDRLNDRRLRLAVRDHRVDEFSRPCWRSWRLSASSAPSGTAAFASSRGR
jgi:ABC-type multidrug transport system fused ATPase/permease subunit